MIKRVIKFIYRKTFFKFFRGIKNNLMQKKFKNNGVSIISSNCIAGCIYSDLKQPFNSPTINCFFYSNSFVKFSDNLEYYLRLDLKEVISSKDAGYVNYPVGCLDDVEIHFLHYKSFEEANKKWTQRRDRVNFNNVVFLMTDRDVNNQSDLDLFITQDNGDKLIFTTKNFENSSEYIYCDKENGSVISPDFTTFRKYEHYIDIVEWLNNAKRQ